VDVDRFRFVDRSGRSKRVKQIVCTRRQELIYDNDVVVDALANLRDRGCSFRAVMVGGGPLLEERKEQVRRHGLDQVEFTGQIDPDRLGKILEESEIYVSAAVSDGTSSSLLEAMASGLFPVLARIRGNLDWIRDGETGLFFKVSDAGDLSRALERSLAGDLLRARAAPQNRSLAERQGDRRVNMERMMELLEWPGSLSSPRCGASDPRPPPAPPSRRSGGASRTPGP
jgi:glycosyltransferase involved in cell wall biosynthesis